MKKTWSSILAMLMVCALVLTACSSGGGTSTADSSNEAASTATESTVEESTSTEESTAEASTGASDIVAATDADFVTMDPADATNTMDGAVQRLIMDGLFGFDREMKVINMLATGYTANDNATEYNITLREGIAFSDGVAWNADAAKANLDKLSDQSLGLKRNGLFSMIDSTEVVSDYEIKVTLNEPFGAFINTLAHPAGVMMSPAQIEAGQDVCAQNPVGTGQYTFVEWRPGEFLKIELNPDWWGYDAGICGGTALVASNAGFDSITFKPVGENATRVAMIQSGDADYIYPVPTESFSVLEADPNVNVVGEESIIMQYVYINTQKEIFSDVRVRQALNHAISKEAYVQVVYNGYSTPAESYMSPAVQFYQAQEPYEYDLEKAKELMTEAGYADGFEMDILLVNTTTSIKFAEFLQQQLGEIGITINITPVESGTFSEMVDGNTGGGAAAPYDAVLRGWSPSTGDADWVLRAIFSLTLSPPNGSAYSYFDNADFEAAIAAGLGSADLTVRGDAYATAQQILWEECPAVPMGNTFNTWATSTKIDGCGRYPDGGVYFRDGVYLG